MHLISFGVYRRNLHFLLKFCFQNSNLQEIRNDYLEPEIARTKTRNDCKMKIVQSFSKRLNYWQATGHCPVAVVAGSSPVFENSHWVSQWRNICFWKILLNTTIVLGWRLPQVTNCQHQQDGLRLKKNDFQPNFVPIYMGFLLAISISCPSTWLQTSTFYTMLEKLFQYLKEFNSKGQINLVYFRFWSWRISWDVWKISEDTISALPIHSSFWENRCLWHIWTFEYYFATNASPW